MSKADDYARGVEHSTFVYREVINEYVAENIKLKKALLYLSSFAKPCGVELEDVCKMFGIEVDE